MRSAGGAKPKVETNTRKILDRPVAEGWVADGGSNHIKLAHPSKPGIKIMVPRRRELDRGRPVR
jgi:hypothetical protein